MHRSINQINVSITTNRGCNLRCEHCYIQPHLFKDPRMMTKDDARLIFDRIEELISLDANIEEVEWEAIGGETTLMPYEWWDEMLPYMLDRIEVINRRLKIPGSLNFLTNMMIRDERYFDLFNRYANHPAFVIYTSWEPDTRRFGTNNKLFPKFLDNLKKLKVPQLILDIILTKEVCDHGGKWVAETFVAHGVTDFSCKMLSPYGSGKAFFHKAMTGFSKMELFLDELQQNLPAGVTYTPSEEMLSSLYRGTSFQCNGNFLYDLSIEPDGRTHFNANQTADEMVSGGMTIELTDPLWARKVILGNTQEAAGKLTLAHPSCHQCEFLRFCNAGWWHYKVNPEIIQNYEDGECPGFSRHWQRKKDQLSGSCLNITHKNYKDSLKRSLVPPLTSADKDIAESDLTSVEMLLSVPTGAKVQLVPQVILNKTLAERLVWYDARRISVTMSFEAAQVLSDDDLSTLLTWQVSGILKHCAPLKNTSLIDLVLARPAMMVSRMICDAAKYISIIQSRTAPGISTNMKPPTVPYLTKALPQAGSGLICDQRNDELFTWLLHHLSRTSDLQLLAATSKADRALTLAEYDWLVQKAAQITQL